MSVVDYKLQLSYKRILKDFLENKSEQSLYEAQKVSKFLLEQKFRLKNLSASILKC